VRIGHSNFLFHVGCIQVAVAVMKEMDTGGTEAAVAAKDFAKQLHARWGVGRAECQVRP